MFLPFGYIFRCLSYLRRIADLKVDKFGEGAVNTDIAKAIFDHFAGQNIKVLSIQQCCNKVARVTFEDQTACECVQLRGELDVGGVTWMLSRRLPLPQIGLMLLCIITPTMLLTPILMMPWAIIGKIQSVRYHHWTNLPEVSTGTGCAY